MAEGAGHEPAAAPAPAAPEDEDDDLESARQGAYAELLDACEDHIIAAQREASARMDTLHAMLQSGAGGTKGMTASSPSYVIQQPPLLVLEILAQGGHAVKEMEREEVLEVAQNAVPGVSTSVSGAVAQRKKLERLQGALQPRDVRLFDPAYSNSQDPMILVRRHAVLINLDPIRALVLHNRAFLFVEDGADELLGKVLQRIEADEIRMNDANFEMRVYEAVFLTTCCSLDDDLDAIIPEVRSTIREVVGSTSGVVLERLRQVAREVSRLEQRVTSNRVALSEVLRVNTDMALMNLANVQARPELYVDKLKALWEYDHEEIELILETYLQAADSTYASARALELELAQARSSMSLRLSQAQNKLLTVEVLVSSATAVSTYGALVAAVFGMNLSSGVEEDPHWFWTVFSVIVVAMPLSMLIIFRCVKRHGVLLS